MASSPSWSRPLQRHHAHPEHRLVADFDIVFAHEGQLAITADAHHRQASMYGLDRIALPHIHWQVVFDDQHAPARVDVKSPRVYAAGLDVLDRRRFAGGLIDGVHHDAVLATFEYRPTLKLDRGFSAIRPVQKTTVRMDVN